MKNAPRRATGKHALAALILSTCTGTVLADAIGLRAGAYSWQADYEGEIRAGGELVDLQDDLGYSDDSANVYFVALEHPIPVLPNVMLQHTQLDSSATARIDRQFTFDGVTYPVNEVVDSSVDLTHTDLTLYYELLDNWVHLDLGLTIRNFDNDIELNSPSAGRSTEELAAVLPMLYGAARFDLPLTGLYVAADGNVIAYDGNSLFDYRAVLGYETKIGLGVEVGLRNFDLTYEDGDDEADVSANGVFGSLFFHF